MAMASIRDSVTDAVAEAARKVDSGSIRALYAAVSVPVERERERLRRTRRPFVDPASSEATDPGAVARTARRVIDQAMFKASAVGGVAGLGGLATVPPEVVATLVSVVRLAQRLAIVYGFDPATDRGQMALQQALSAGLGVDLPDGGPLGLSASDLPKVLLGSVPTEVDAAMTRQLVRQSAWMVVGSIARFVPGLAVGAGVVRSRSRMREVGEKMREALERLAGLPAGAPGADIVEAVEVR